MAVECVIGVDLGGARVLAGAVDDGLSVHHRARRKTAELSQAGVLDTVADAIAELRNATDGEVGAVGFGVPSVLAAASGGLGFRELISERLDVPVAFDNDGNAAMLAEHRFGAARGAENAVLLCIGSEIVGAAVVDGRLMRGATGAAGELGQMVVDGARAPGTLSALASGSRLAAEAARVAGAAPSSALGEALAAGRLTSALTVEIAHDGDAAARAVVAAIGEQLGIGIANLMSVFDPEVVVIGGGVMAAGDLLLGPARRVAQERSDSPVAQIVPARFGAESGMLGAAVAALDLLARRVP